MGAGGRPPLAVGTYGTLTAKAVKGADGKVKHWTAHARVRDRDGVTRSARRNGPTKGKAEAALRDALVDRIAPTAGALRADSKFEVAAKAWLEDVAANKAGTTYDTYNGVLRNVVLPRLGQLRLREIDRAVVAETLRRLRDDYSPNYLRTIRTAISGPMQIAEDQELISHNPAIGRATRIEGGGKEPRALTEDEQRWLLHFVDNDEKAKRNELPELIRFLLNTGCRISEALAVRWCDVNLVEGWVHINGAITRKRGEGQKRTDTKTTAGNRTLHLPGSLTMMLRVRWDESVMTPDLPVFPGVVAHKRWRDLNNTQKLIRYARAKVLNDDGQSAGLDWLTTHTARRTVADILDKGEATPRAVADQLGHSRPSMSQDVYMARRGRNDTRSADMIELRNTPKSKPAPA